MKKLFMLIIGMLAFINVSASRATTTETRIRMKRKWKRFYL